MSGLRIASILAFFPLYYSVDKQLEKLNICRAACVYCTPFVGSKLHTWVTMAVYVFGFCHCHSRMEKEKKSGLLSNISILDIYSQCLQFFNNKYIQQIKHSYVAGDICSRAGVSKNKIKYQLKLK